ILFVPYSSMIEIMLWRMPVRIDATTIAAITPMTIPSTVRKLRNLFERTLSSAIFSVSRGKILGKRSFTIHICHRGTETRRKERSSRQKAQEAQKKDRPQVDPVVLSPFCAFCAFLWLAFSVSPCLSRFCQRDD